MHKWVYSAIAAAKSQPDGQEFETFDDRVQALESQAQ